MSGLTKEQTTEGFADLHLRLPAAKYAKAREAIRKLLDLGEVPYQELNAQNEEVYSVADVFGEITPAQVLRGMRHREGLKQKDLAQKLGIPAANLSEMENGRRPIGKAMAKRLAQALNANYKVFL